jgi:hypothetical protein
VVALDEQHLQQHFALGIYFCGVAFDFERGGGLRRAGGSGAAIDFHAAQSAGTVGYKVGMPAQVRDVAASTGGGLQNALPGLELHVLAIE